MAVCFNYLSIAIFLNIDISQGSVATRLRCGGMFKYDLVANLPVKEFWKSVNISGSYGQEFGVLFFSETQCISVYSGFGSDIASITYTVFSPKQSLPFCC